MPTVNKEGPFYKKYIDSNILGKFKPEMPEKIGAETGEGVFVMNKGYAIRNKETGYESVKCKGVVAWVIGDKKSDVERREHAGIARMGFDDMVNLTEGKDFSYRIR